MTAQQKGAVKLISERSLLGFHRCFFNIVTGERWTVNWHHKYIAKIIEDVIEGRRGSVIINVPPGAGKTELLSIHAPVYSMIKKKKVRNLNISFSNTLVQRNSLRSKDIIKSQEFQELWPIDIGKDKADEWQVLDDKGKVKAEIISRSIGGQITGARGGYALDGFSGWICLDDVDKPEDMFSDIKRQRTHNILVNTLRSRRARKSKKNPTPFVVIQQRLHIDDSTAFLTDPKRGIGVDFEVIKIPALIDQDYIDELPDWIRDDCIKDVCSEKQVNGKWSFWPQNEDIDDLMNLWEKSAYTFMSQYMQDPISLGGSIFNAEWFRFYGDESFTGEDGKEQFRFEHRTPANFEYRFITADTAQKTKTYNDFSVICEWGISKGNLYLIDMIRRKMEAPDLRRTFKAKAIEAFNKNCFKNGNLRKILVEDKSSGTGLIQDLNADPEMPIRITAVQRNTDKVTRALDTSTQIELGKLYIPGNEKWTTEFVSEHSLFSHNDSHKHDDIVDNTCDAVSEALLVNAKNKVTDLMFQRRT